MPRQCTIFRIGFMVQSDLIGEYYYIYIEVSNLYMKYIFRVILLLIISMSFNSYQNAQNFGGVPPNKEWSTHTINDVRIIYDKNVKHSADTISRIIHAIDREVPYSLGNNTEFLHLILRNENLTSNGFVSYFPYRSEFFIHGAQNPNAIGYGEWIKLLSYHEYRHAMQYSNFNRGITKLIHSVLGDASVAGIYNFLVPDWFSEGDAVFFETALTRNGRGRLPSFTSDLRALLLDSINYSYEKFRNGSFKDLVPNEYVMGYILATYGHQNYGKEFWKNTLQETGRLKGLIFPFSKGIKRNSQLSLAQFYHQAFRSYRSTLPYSSYNLKDNQFAFEKDANIKDEIVSYSLNGAKILLENTYDEIPTVYSIDDREKKTKLFELGNTTDPFIQVSDSRILFINKRVHHRWTNREFGDIWYYDTNKGTIQKVTKDKKFLSCDFNESNQHFVAVSGTSDGRYAITLLNEQGMVIDTIVPVTSEYLSSPLWGEDEQCIYFTSRKNGKISLQKYDFQLQNIQSLISDYNGTIANPFIRGHELFFSSSISGIDNIYKYDLDNGDIHQITDIKTGAYAPTLDPVNHILYYSVSTAEGKRIVTQNIYEDATSEPLDAINSFEHNSNWIPNYVELSKLPPQPSLQKPYRPFLHLLNFHSIYLTPDLETPKLSILSNDYLNTTRAEIYGQYFDADQSFKTGAELTYAKWYPELSVGADHRFNRTLIIRTDRNIYRIPKSETSLTGSVRLPLVFSSRQNHQFLNIGSRFDLTKEHFDPNHESLPDNFNIQPRLFQRSQGSITWQLTRRQAYRDIFPKWGFIFHGVYKRGWSPQISELAYIRSEFFIPGFFKNDGWKFRAQGQWNSDLAGSYLPLELATSSNIRYTHSSFTKGSFLTGNYMLPLAYPELAIPHFLYTKRIALNFFGEYFVSEHENQSAYGVDLFLTARYFNLLDLTVGLRTQMVNNKDLDFGIILLQNL